MKQKALRIGICIATALVLGNGVARGVIADKKEIRRLNANIAWDAGYTASLELKLQAKVEEVDKITALLEEHRCTETILYVPEEKFKEFDVPLDAALQRYTYDMCVEYGIEDYYATVIALMHQESNFVVNAISSTNDYGLMQINISNHAGLKNKLQIVDFLDAEQNIKAGVYMLSTYLHDELNVHKALMSYNMGQGGAAKLWAQGIYSSVYSRGVTAKQAELLTK